MRCLELGLEIKIIRNVEEVEGIRSIWQKMQYHPNTDIDHYLTVISTLKDVILPHLILVSQNGQPIALAVGRLEKRHMGIMVGYKTLFKFQVPCLTILYGGLLGDWDEETCHILIAELVKSLKRNEAVIAWFNLLRSDKPIYEVARKKPGFFYRDHVVETNLHWKMALPESLNSFLGKMTSKHRYWLKRLPRVLEKDYPGKIAFKYYHQRDDLDRLFIDAEEIAKKTYQRNLDVGFIDNSQMRKRLTLLAERDRLRAYLLYVNETPCAFWIGTLYGKVFYLDFTGYDSTFRRYEPGTILFMKMLEDLSGSDATEIDFGFGDAFYKQRFGDQNWIESSVFIYAPTIKGILLNAIRTVNLVPYSYLSRLANRINILQKIKRIWRNKLIAN